MFERGAAATHPGRWEWWFSRCSGHGCGTGWLFGPRVAVDVFVLGQGTVGGRGSRARRAGCGRGPRGLRAACSVGGWGARRAGCPGHSVTRWSGGHRAGSTWRDTPHGRLRLPHAPRRGALSGPLCSGPGRGGVDTVSDCGCSRPCGDGRGDRGGLSRTTVMEARRRPMPAYGGTYRAQAAGEGRSRPDAVGRNGIGP